MSTRIGCDHAVYSILTEDSSGVPTYSTPVELPGVVQVGVNPNSSTATLFADDGPYESATTLGNVEVTFEKASLSNKETAALLGHKLDTNSVVVYGSNDVAPYVAFGFRSLKSDGTYRYVWLYKGKFADGEATYQTKGDSVEFQTDTVTGNFTKLTKEYTIGGKAVYPYKIEVDEGENPATDAIIAKWFTAVVLPNAS